MRFRDMFDAYSLQARLQPALLALFPALLTAAAWHPQIVEWRTILYAALLACGVLAFLMHLTRDLGHAAQARLFKAWEGRPTTARLRHRDGAIDPGTKGRYHAKLAKKIKGWRAPTSAQEAADPVAADERYEAAVTWLLENTRDAKAFPLVAKENVSYGFRRNLFGLRHLGMLIAIAALVASGYLVYRQTQTAHGVEAIGLVAIAGSTLALIAWATIVRGSWVKRAAELFAQRLLAACDKL